MKTYIEPSKELEIICKVDVLVIGAGPAGVSAAITASRTGVSTLLVEQSSDVGGVATTGLMSHWTGGTKGGFYEELLDRTCDLNEMRQVINPEKLKTQLLVMLAESNVMLKLYTFASDIIMDDDEIKGVIIESKSGRQVIMAKVVIDTSGDGDIAAKAGVTFEKGRKCDGKMQPMTLMFKVANVDSKRAVFLGGFEDTYETPRGELQALGKQILPFPSGHVLLYKSTLPGVVTCNMTNVIDVDGTNADDLTKAHIQARMQMDKIVEFLHEYVEGYENCYLISSASQIGVRETRRFIGEYILTQDDILKARTFDDEVVTNALFNFDVHNIAGAGLDETGAQKHFKQRLGYSIPYRCFISKKVKNLFFAGRIMSGTHIAHSNYRVMPICANMGAAVGNAAALCIKDNCNVMDVNIKKLQDILDI